ncbi:MAG: hypothetical protein WCR56_07455, partial [Bacilli bacterium]
DDQIPSNQIVTRKIHELDSKIFITITHPGLDCSISYSDKPGLTPTLTYTNYLSSYYQQVITINEIKKIETQFGSIAKRAKIAGYDGLLISARKLSLLSLFLSPWYNQRSDDYGGSKEKRFRIIAEIYKKVRKEVGPDYPMGLELDATQLFPPGRTVEDTAELCKDCQDLGFDYILLNRHFAAEESHYNLAKKKIYFSQDCDFGKKIKASLSIPVLLNTAFYDFNQMEKLINDKYADLLCLGTESLAEPNYPKFC